MRVAGMTYRRHPGALSAVGLIAIPIAALALLLAAFIEHLPFVGALVTASDPEDSGGRFIIASLIGGLFGIFAFVLISAAVAWIVGGPGGLRPSARDALHAVARRTGPLAAAFLPAAVLIVALELVVIGIPIAIWLFVRWQFLPQVTMLEGRAGLDTLARSGELVRGRWWHTAIVTVVVTLVLGTVGVVVGLLLLVLFTGLPLWALSMIVTLSDVLLMPFLALVMTYLYGDAVASTTATFVAPEPVPV